MPLGSRPGASKTTVARSESLGVASEDIQKKQAAHLENFGRLAKLGSLTTAGPCSDPDKATRGIVVINADSIADAENLFGPDLYVSEGYMKAELHEYKTLGFTRGTKPLAKIRTLT